jgi:hypothetical protein
VGLVSSLFKIRLGSSTIVMHFGVASRRFCGQWRGINLASRRGSDSWCPFGGERIFDQVMPGPDRPQTENGAIRASGRECLSQADCLRSRHRGTRRTHPANGRLAAAAAAPPACALQEHDNGVVLSRSKGTLRLRKRLAAKSARCGGGREKTAGGSTISGYRSPETLTSGYAQNMSRLTIFGCRLSNFPLPVVLEPLRLIRMLRAQFLRALP